MGRAKIEALPVPVKAAVDELLKTGRFTLDQIIAHLRKLGSEHQVPEAALPSRSAIGRYAQRFEKTAAKLREAREIASTWVQKLGDDPEGSVSRLLQEMLKTVAFQQLAQMNEAEEPPEASEIMLLARSIKDLESAASQSMQRELRIRKDVIAEMAKKLSGLEKDGKTGKRALDPETIKAVREIYGITAHE